jgi:SAM-dependent methyltransferase
MRLILILFCLFFSFSFLEAGKKPKPTPAPQPTYTKFRESDLAHYLLDGLRGIEIGGSAHNPFGLKTLNVDYTDELTEFKLGEIQMCGEFRKVDIVSAGDDLPFKDNVWDFVISSHAIEHFYDPVKTVKEWLRVVKPGGYVYIIAPHKERTFDRDRPRTPLAEIVDRHDNPNPPVPMTYIHHSVWITSDFVDICNYYGWKVLAVQDVDDKVGNGFTIVIQK